MADRGLNGSRFSGVTQNVCRGARRKRFKADASLLKTRIKANKKVLELRAVNAYI